MTRIAIAGFLAAVILFVWNALAWMVLSMHASSLRPLPNERAVVEALRESHHESGAFFFPSPSHDPDADEQAQEAAMDAFLEAHRQGPVGMLVYNAEGLEPLAPSTFLRGFVLDLLSGLLAATLLAAAAARLRSYGGRVLFVAALGVFVGLVSDLGYWNWMHFPTEYSFVMAADRTIGWLLVALVAAAVVRPTRGG